MPPPGPDCATLTTSWKYARNASGRRGRRRHAVRIVRFRVGGGQPRAGVVLDDGRIRPVAAPGLSDLLALPAGRIREICAAPGRERVPLAEAELLALTAGRTDCSTAGVTSFRSRTAPWAESESC